jgi:hypothetical protein
MFGNWYLPYKMLKVARQRTGTRANPETSDSFTRLIEPGIRDLCFPCEPAWSEAWRSS